MVGNSKVGIILYIMNVAHQFFFFLIHYVKSRMKQRSVCAMSTIYTKANLQMAIIMLKKTLYFTLTSVLVSMLILSFVILLKYTCVIIKVQQEFPFMLNYYLTYKDQLDILSNLHECILITTFFTQKKNSIEIIDFDLNSY